MKILNEEIFVNITLSSTILNLVLTAPPFHYNKDNNNKGPSKSFKYFGIIFLEC